MGSARIKPVALFFCGLCFRKSTIKMDGKQLTTKTNQSNGMTIELYEAPESVESESVESPISSTTGELPDQEPTLDLGNLLGSFDSQEDALAFLEEKTSRQNQQITDSDIRAYNAYTHVSLLTVTIQTKDSSAQKKNYYLVTDEGY